MDRESLLTKLVCPYCKGKMLVKQDSASCETCSIEFLRKSNRVFSFINFNAYRSNNDEQDMESLIEFWEKGWEKRLSEDDHRFLFELNSSFLKENLIGKISHWKETGSTLIGRYIDLNDVQNKTCLCVGCGSGLESAVFAIHGAHTIAMDITNNAASAADYLINKVGGSGLGIQADARYIPIEDCSVDIVHSQGVLHHSPDINRSISEVYRVLKPGGRAYVMLYATYSAVYMKVRLKGLLKGYITSRNQKDFMGMETEQPWITENKRNQYTETFSIGEIKRLFRIFRSVNICKGAFNLDHFIPGRIIKGRSLDIPSIARFLDPLFGCCLFISAVK